MRAFYHIFILALILAVSASPLTVWAQVLEPSTHPVVFSYLTVNEGLPSNTVRALMQDNYGFIWVGTSKGIGRYDGHQVHSLPESRNLSVTSMCQTGDTVWVGTENGLYLYLQSRAMFEKYNKKLYNAMLSSINVAQISKDNRGNVWVATMGQGIVKIDVAHDELTVVPTPSDTKDYGSIYVDSKDRVWGVTNWSQYPIVIYDEQAKKFIPFELRFLDSSERVTSTLCIVEGSDNHMWTADWNGQLVRFNASNHFAEVVMSAAQSGVKNVHSIFELRDCNFIIGSDDGLLMYSYGDHVKVLHTRASMEHSPISDNFVYPIMKDREGGFWIGTFYGGVNYTHPSSAKFRSFTHSNYSNSVSGSVISRFCEDDRGRVWIASDDGGLSCYNPDDKSFLNIDLARGQGSPHNVHALCVLDGKLYVGTYSQGIDVVDLATLTVTNIPAFIDASGKALDSSAFSIYKDKKSRLWVGTFGEVCIFDPSSCVFKKMHSIEAPVLSIIQEKNGKMWFATEAKGVWSYDEKTGKWKHYSEFAKTKADHPLTTVSVNSFYEDGKGVLWAGTSEGLFRYDRKEDKFVGEEISITPLHVMGILGEGNHLWLATNQGLRRFSTVDKNEIVQVFKSGANLVSTDFLPDAVLRTSKGEMLVGTTNGFLSFTPSAMLRNEVQPKVVFTTLEIFNKPVAVGSEFLPMPLADMEELRLTYRENVIRISFSAMSFLQSSSVGYSYYLEGFDEDWVAAGNLHSVTYTNLSPGTYTLHVKAANSDGIISPETTLRIVITPPFYWNTTAQIIYVLLVIALLYYVARRFQKRVEKRHVAEIEEINTQKEQEIHEIHVQKEQEIQEINIQKEHEIQEINIQKEQEIQEINIQKEQEIHDARIKFMTITQKDQEFLDKLENVIEQNFSSPDLSVEFIASAIGISRTGLFTKLKTLADVTPNEMIQVIRLKHAAELLQSKQYRVSEVCYMVGFSSPSYFAKCFQKQYGVTPAKYVN